MLALNSPAASKSVRRCLHATHIIGQDILLVSLRTSLLIAYLLFFTAFMCHIQLPAYLILVAYAAMTQLMLIFYVDLSESFSSPISTNPFLGPCQIELPTMVIKNISRRFTPWVIERFKNSHFSEIQSLFTPTARQYKHRPAFSSKRSSEVHK